MDQENACMANRELAVATPVEEVKQPEGQTDPTQRPWILAHAQPTSLILSPFPYCASLYRNSFSLFLALKPAFPSPSLNNVGQPIWTMKYRQLNLR
ncbi:unnamed protein product [Ilex paraguariensis]|uniref:Uncharacterized protein n=1 Tax=Ilex paraguariensis TaxID=185542 RepID=A0ABC8QYR3_9AQUA